ncbi:hypothetical protein SAMN06265348_11453 [Pedobacter westerhofensis]|uniref:FHA domain-containing protein n=1 Tax=Pedobacter westerhofensis TaxID=425512 RepID=A0A521FMU6_9SPHI|nr:FHA domain-containing protein [Pedobacter westerhofensis]SMO97436.1 hypothetical protein SAMN06265348_11453 [Pedobacter westerhofensis]
MFDFFKRNTKLDAKGIRDAILQFIKEELQQLDGGEGSALQSVSLFVSPNEEEKFLYEAALYNGNTEKLREDVQRIADNFALDLPADWQLALQFEDELPSGTLRSNEIKARLKLTMSAPAEVTQPAGASVTGIGAAVKVSLKVLKGKAEQDEYILKPEAGKRINIGREAIIQANDGSLRINHIAFPEDPAYESNKYISRQHAHIEWDVPSASFKLYADEGGVPPGNKTKIRTAHDESINKLNSTAVGYPLKDRDQIILGDAAILEFTVILQ